MYGKKQLALLCCLIVLAMSTGCKENSPSGSGSSAGESVYSPASGSGEASYELPHADPPSRMEELSHEEYSTWAPAPEVERIPTEQPPAQEEESPESIPEAVFLESLPDEISASSPEGGTALRAQAEDIPAPSPGGGTFYSSTEGSGDFEISSTQFEEELFSLINSERIAEGAASLTLDDSLQWAARVRAPEVLNSLSHTRPDGTPYYTAFDEAGYVYAGKWHGENVSSMYFTHGEFDAASAAAFMFEELKGSSGHYSNMLSGNFTEMGIGVFVQKDGANITIASAQMFAGG